jgi:hypothetical protein
MLRKLPFQTIGDIGRCGVELHVYCPRCYSTRRLVDLGRWADRCFATARFRCTGTRYDGHTLPRNWHAGHPAGRAAAGWWTGDARLPHLPALHLGDKPGSARQAAMVGKPPALSLPWLRRARRLAHTWCGMAAWVRCCCILGADERAQY